MEEEAGRPESPARVKAGVGLLPGYTRTDGSEQDDEWRAILEFWLTAFPKQGLSTGHWE